MKIENLKSEKKGDRARVSAEMSWEDCERPSQEIYFETWEAFADDLTCNPNAFLLACAIPAMYYGERRVFIDAEICPELRDGLLAAMGWLRYWFYEPGQELIQIEAKASANLPNQRTPERAAMMLSGGMDSLGMLCENRLNFPAEHPWSIKDGLHIYGLELDDLQAFEYVVDYFSGIDKAGITYIPVFTNLYLHLREDDAKNGFDFWYYQFYGAALSSVAHAFSRRLTTACIASDYDVPNQKPHGSHPLLDLSYSSSDLRIRHKAINLSRLDKTKLIADWETLYPYIRVCNRYKAYRPGQVNCGKCEKCVRTMLAFLALEKLAKIPAFPDDVSQELLSSVLNLKRNEYLILFYNELLAPLADIGRSDLVDVIEAEIARYYYQEPAWKVKIRNFDQVYLNGKLKKLASKIK